MPTSRRTFKTEEKARIVLEIPREEKSISQIASEAGNNANVLNRWKNDATQNLSQLFVDDRKGITKMKKNTNSRSKNSTPSGQVHHSIIVAQKKSGR